MNRRKFGASLEVLARRCGRIPENARGDVASTANSNHEVGLKVIEDLLCCLLAELVDLYKPMSVLGSRVVR